MSMYEMLKDAAKVAQKADNVELVQKLLDVQKAALDMQEKERQLKMQIEKLESDNRRLNTLQEEYVPAAGVYWRKVDTNKDQPYCPVCYSKGIAMPLQKFLSDRPKDKTSWVCPDTKCKAGFSPWSHSEAGVV